MKVIDRYEIEYVVPESEAEKQAIESIIINDRKKESDTFNPENLSVVKPKQSNQQGYWRKS